MKECEGRNYLYLEKLGACPSLEKWYRQITSWWRLTSNMTTPSYDKVIPNSTTNPWLDADSCTQYGLPIMRLFPSCVPWRWVVTSNSMLQNCKVSVPNHSLNSLFARELIEQTDPAHECTRPKIEWMGQRSCSINKRLEFGPAKANYPHPSTEFSKSQHLFFHYHLAPITHRRPRIYELLGTLDKHKLHNGPWDFSSLSSCMY